MSERAVIHETDLEGARAVHVQIPEFDPDYIENNIERIGLNDKKPFIITAEVDGTDVGYLIAYERERTDGDSMHIWLNGVAPDYRGQGIFQTMIAVLEKEAMKRNRNEITVKSDERFGPMLGALAKFGFAITEQDGTSVRLAKPLRPPRIEPRN